MKEYKIKEISKLTSLSIRTLQYYDDIDLLKPSRRSEADYRLYSEDDLLRLQQITTLKYLGCSLAAIRNIIQHPGFNLKKSLALQATVLAEQAQKINEASALLNYIAAQINAGHPVNWYSTTQIIHILESSTMSKELKNNYQNMANQSELGQKSEYDATYNPERLYAIPRAPKRKEINLDPITLSFHGFDCWNHYEVSWLNPKGKPMVAIAVISYDCHSPFIIESKSLKLYFNSFNNHVFSDVQAVEQTVRQDLSRCIDAEATVSITPLTDLKNQTLHSSFSGTCLDTLDIECSSYMVDSSFLTTSNEQVEEVLYSDLLKSNCLVTNQPDWGSVQIAYKGKKLNHEGLLKYLVSFRNHNEFHEQCIERIFTDIMTLCQPESLTVYGRYTRRGGLDINPFRSTEPCSIGDKNIRLIRQ
ncbi:NADPH-dependent 7-cyano-7-deazaguanine reductase [Legionella fallonii LLAP-10]|uniref:NADPH-dependent 7-cyano-7-deazaguanine reductase n=2 Tax=Legionella fallonii TaxID=96230 RepID=A0A098G953_9GAMM|nr:NADPH-dependent 7-cyano-7-deazaguanine reductase [Legionella fallonii LLAP-10]